MVKKILLVEDDEMLREIYGSKLQSEGFELTAIDNGGDGLLAAKAQIFDLILLDVILAQLDGFSILEDLKSKPETSGMPVVMLTNLGTHEDRLKGEKLGAADYLVKSNITPEQLIQSIAKYLA
ncbi:MAG: response regulator [bacterium]